MNDNDNLDICEFNRIIYKIIEDRDKYFNTIFDLIHYSYNGDISVYDDTLFKIRKIRLLIGELDDCQNYYANRIDYLKKEVIINEKS